MATNLFGGWYGLDDDRNVVPANRFPTQDERKAWRVGSTRVGQYRVSTVFLGLDHQYGDGPPLVFETMVFEGEGFGDLYCERYATWEDAEAGHNHTVARLKRERLNAVAWRVFLVLVFIVGAIVFLDGILEVALFQILASMGTMGGAVYALMHSGQDPSDD